jgi:DNA modification methylase
MIAQADCFRIPLADKSVHCVVTSPPYWGLRKYTGDQGTEPLGLEPTPERHIERTVQWAREVYRVLRDDGVFWLNYGDSYSGSGGENGNGGLGMDTSEKHGNYRDNPRKRTVAGGNLTMMPHRVALALQADGWIVRQDLVWSKPNPMPESCRGWSFNPDGELRRGSWRHTRAHEYVFMLTKQMQYWSDQEAVREPAIMRPQSRGTDGRGDKSAGYADHRQASGDTDPNEQRGGRNPRSVLHIPTAPYRGAHYATFPPALIAPLILATCPRWCCPVCGQGWAPAVERYGNKAREQLEIRGPSGYASAQPTAPQGLDYAGSHGDNAPEVKVLGHRPTCEHPHTQAEAVPGIVFDPFVGSGTTVMSARQLGRRGIGIDISRPYLVEQASERINSEPKGKWKKTLEGLIE